MTIITKCDRTTHIRGIGFCLAFILLGDENHWQSRTSLIYRFCFFCDFRQHGADDDVPRHAGSVYPAGYQCGGGISYHDHRMDIRLRQGCREGQTGERNNEKYCFVIARLRPVYTCDICCDFGGTFQCNFGRARIRDENRKCKLAAISMRFVCAISQRFRTYSKLHATWWRFEVKLM